MSQKIERPNPGETEDDLLRLQQEFQKNKKKPSVTLIRRKNPDDPPNYPEQPKKKKVHNDQLATEEGGLPTILSDVKERDCLTDLSLFHRPISSVGFPKVLHRNVSGNESYRRDSSPVDQPISKKKPSIFAQQMQRLRPEDLGVSTVIKNSQDSTACVGDPESMSNFVTPHLITGDGLAGFSGSHEVRTIHQENLHRLSQLTPEALKEEQRRITESLDPKLLQFICNKTKSQPANTKPLPPKIMKSQNHKTEPIKSNLEDSEDVKDFPIRPDPNIPHFDKFEKEKLAWMKQIPDTQTKLDPNASEARFDFNGCIIPPGVEIPSHLGLHHHGEEPGRAGYTIEELFTLSRSAFPQQRNLAVKTLTACIRQSQWSVGHIGQLASPLVSLLPTMLDAGLAFLARWLLDDAVSSAVHAGGSSEQGDLQVAAVIDLFHAMLCAPQDESDLNLFFSWRNNLGLILPNLETKASIDDRTESANQKESDRLILTDYDSLQLDLVDGLVSKTHLLPRLAYLVEMKIYLPADSVVHLLHILTRIARHSRSLAYQIVQNKQLLPLLVRHFLPKMWEPNDLNDDGMIDNAYGRPSPHLLILLRTLCQSSRSIALNLNGEFSLLDRCLIYLAQNYRDLSLPNRISADLQIESLRYLSVMVSYGIEMTHFIDSHPSFIKLFHDALKLWKKNPMADINSSLLISWIDYFTLFLRSICTGGDLNSESLTLLSFLVDLVKDLMDEFRKHYHEKKCNIPLLSSCLQFLCAYIHGRQSLCGESSQSLVSDCETLIGSHITLLLNSIAFSNIFSTYRSEATVLCQEFKSTWRPILLAPSCHVNRGTRLILQRVTHDTEPISADDDREESSINTRWPSDRGMQCLCLLSSVVNVVHTLTRVYKSGATHELVKQFLSQADLVSFLRACERHLAHPDWSNSDSQCTVWNAMFELDLAGEILLLAQYLPMRMGAGSESTLDLSLFHNVALKILPLLIKGQEKLAENLLKSVVFNADFVFGSEDNSISWLTLAPSSGSKFIEDLRTNLLSISGCYLNHMNHLINPGHQQNTEMGYPDSFALIGCCLEDRLLPIDWSFLPLISIYQATLECSSEDEQLNCPEIPVLHCLRWLSYLESFPGRIVRDSCSIATRFSRLLCVFLCSSELLFNEWGKFYLQLLLTLLTQPMKLSRIQLEEKIPGLSGFYDIFVELILQYMAVSYGDPLFCNYLLLSCHQRHHVKYRRALWGEYQRVLRVITISVDQLATPLTLFLEPEESSDEMIKFYLQSLISQSINAERNPLLYVIVVHHLNSFLYRQFVGDEKLVLQRQYYRLIVGLGDPLTNHILCYRCPDSNCSIGFRLFDDLPELRVKQLNLLKSM